MKRLPLLLKRFSSSLLILGLLASQHCAAFAQSQPKEEDSSLFKLVNTEGVVIEAEIIRVEGNNASIRLKDGKNFTIPFSMLNAESRKIVQAWAVDQALANSLEIRVRERTLKRERTNTNQTTGDVRSIQLNFTVTNKSGTAIDDLRIDFRTFITRELVAAPNKDFSQEQVMGGSFPIKKIAAGEELTFQSPVIELRSEKLNGNVVPAQGNNRSAQDKIEGYWYRLYRGKNMITEDAAPRRLIRAKEW